MQKKHVLQLFFIAFCLLASGSAFGLSGRLNQNLDLILPSVALGSSRYAVTLAFDATVSGGAGVFFKFKSAIPTSAGGECGGTINAQLGISNLCVLFSGRRYLMDLAYHFNPADPNWPYWRLTSIEEVPLSIVTVLDSFEAPIAGSPLYGYEVRWQNRDLEYHGEGVAQSVIYGYDLMADADDVPELRPGNARVRLVRWGTDVPSGQDWLDNATLAFRTVYAAGCRIFNISFGSIAESTPQFDAWMVQFAKEKERAGDPILIFIGAGNDPRNTSTFDNMPAQFGELKFFPNYLATEDNPFFVQVTGLEDNLAQVRWCGYESTFSDGWKVDLATSVKLWDFDDAGAPY